MLVCSDAFARGMDFADVQASSSAQAANHTTIHDPQSKRNTLAKRNTVSQAVINYDAPLNAMTYVHRSGRTARAGREGTCISIVTLDEQSRFKNMLRGADNNFVRQWCVGAVARWVRCGNCAGNALKRCARDVHRPALLLLMLMLLL